MRKVVLLSVLLVLALSPAASSSASQLSMADAKWAVRAYAEDGYGGIRRCERWSRRVVTCIVEYEDVQMFHFEGIYGDYYERVWARRSGRTVTITGYWTEAYRVWLPQR